MTNPFENPDAEYRVLMNSECQHSLWPVFVEVPAGWDVAFGPAPRNDCLAYIEDAWTDMRPKSLIDSMNGD
ncbi:MbtH family protein [Streptomyces sp. NPDC007095]|jgi:MbtH protein|uniref:MbtH family protein n=1 Tax=Streptomyces sp. NPDC007095 TaxID=3154482 RepID=UPI000C7031A4